jgi:hypothetical protein
MASVTVDARLAAGKRLPVLTNAGPTLPSAAHDAHPGRAAAIAPLLLVLTLIFKGQRHQAARFSLVGRRRPAKWAR